MAGKNRVWWVTASLNDDDTGWHWRKFFLSRNRAREGHAWGGPGWITSSTSIARIAEMRQGDYVVAYQAQEGVVGLARLASRGYNYRGSEKTDAFDLRETPAIWLETPIPLAAIKLLPRSRDLFEFVRSGRGTVFRVEPGGLERVLALARAYNPEIDSRLGRMVV